MNFRRSGPASSYPSRRIIWGGGPPPPKSTVKQVLFEDSPSNLSPQIWGALRTFQIFFIFSPWGQRREDSCKQMAGGFGLVWKMEEGGGGGFSSEEGVGRKDRVRRGSAGVGLTASSPYRVHPKHLQTCDPVGLLQNRFQASGPKLEKNRKNIGFGLPSPSPGKLGKLPKKEFGAIFRGRASGGRNLYFSYFFLFRAGGPKHICSRPTGSQLQTENPPKLQEKYKNLFPQPTPKSYG